MKFREKSREDPRFDLTPLVDIIFNLIAFFAVTTTFASTGGIGVNLPEASSRQPADKAEKLFVTIDEAGAVYIKGEKKDGEELGRVFSEFASRQPGALVIVQADRRAQHGRVVAVMDLAHSHGLKRLAIATEQKPADNQDQRPASLPGSTSAPPTGPP